jgi:cytochrome b6-f complex iron-sulfur subunit
MHTHPSNQEIRSQPPKGNSRRGVLRAIFGSAAGLGFAALAGATGLWTAATGRFLVPNTNNRSYRRFKAGYPADYPSGCVETRFKEPYGVWIVRSEFRGQERICALRAACTHLGCMTFWDASRQRFQCPCHGSYFGADGANLGGPAPRPLEHVAISIGHDGQLEVDLDRVFNEPDGEPGEPGSYVTISG